MMGGGPAEISQELEQLPPDAFTRDDAALIAATDAIMSGLYDEKRLTCPGHRWLSEEVPSIRGHLIRLYDDRCVHRDASGHWRYSSLTSHFVVGSRWSAWWWRVWKR
jgi:hypothetical protein